MRCHEAIRLMPLFLDSELSSEMTLEVEEHFESCVDCRARLERERALERSMRVTLLEPEAGDAAAWEHAAQRALRIGRHGRLHVNWRAVSAAAAALVAVVASALLWLPPRELDLARSAATDHVRFVAEISDEALPPATMSAFLEAGTQTLPPGSMIPTALPAGYGLLKTGQCKLDGAPVAYVVVGQHAEPISVFLIPRAELRRFPAFAVKLWRERSGVACQVAGRRFFGAGSRNVVACAVGRTNPSELQVLVHWALSD